MYSVEESVEKFKEILQGKPSWQNLQDSQFVEHLAILAGWSLRDAQFKAERTKQEFFIASALNRSSITAHAEDREYLPRKPIAATGAVEIRNKGANSVTLPAYVELYSDGDIVCRTLAPSIIPPGGSSIISVEQKTKTQITHTVSEEKDFYEILLSRDITSMIAGFDVFVDEGYGFEQYQYARLFQNAESDSRVYDEFYAHTEQVGIRFGNGMFGRIPTIDTEIRLDVFETKGDIFLSNGQELFPTNDIFDSNREIAQIEIHVSTSVSGGSPPEGTEEIRNNLRYWPTYNEKLVWDDDYVFFLKRRFSQIIFAKAWGETEAEAMAGSLQFDFINRIFICAYAEDYSGLESDCIEALNNVPLLNRKFTWQDPVHVEFTVSVTGKVLKSVVLSDVETAIKDKLTLYYGQNSTSRRPKVSLSEVYESIQNTGYFVASSGAKFTANIAGQYEPSFLYEMISIDIDSSTFNLTYIE